MSTKLESLRFLRDYDSTIGIILKNEPKRIPAKSTVWEVTYQNGEKKEYLVTLTNIVSKKDKDLDGNDIVVEETTLIQALRNDFWEKKALPVITFSGIQYYIRGTTKNFLGIEKRHFIDLKQNIMPEEKLTENWQEFVKPELEKQAKKDFNNGKPVEYDQEAKREALKKDGNIFTGLIKHADKIESKELLNSELSIELREAAGAPKPPIKDRARKQLHHATRSSTCRYVSLSVASLVIGMGIAYWTGMSAQ